MPNRRQFGITAYHLLESLSVDLYQDASACIWELCRNGLIASMPGKDWLPGVGDIEISLLDDHPLGQNGKTLVILDHGSGFTQPKWDRFFSLGPPLEDGKLRSRGTHSGAAQKCIGRFAAFALNQGCQDKNPDTGFYVITRTAPRGSVTFAELIPSAIEAQGVELKTLDQRDSTLGTLRHVSGSFTAVIIPNPVFKNYEELRRALLWRIARKPEKMCRMLIGDKKLMPPPLVSRVMLSSKTGDIEVFLDRCDTEDSDGGIWLTDAVTGLRVACARGLSNVLPYPLWRPDLTGDIFVPELLHNQDTSRSGLKAQYLRSKEWRSVTSYLVGSVVERAKALLDDEDLFGKSRFDKHILDFVDMCRKIWGAPAAHSSILVEGISPRIQTGISRPRTGNPKRPEGPKKPRQPSFTVRIGDDVYVLSKRQLDPLILAQVDDANSRVIYLNEQSYTAMPPSYQARSEHILLKILEAIGASKSPTDPIEVTRFVAERRIEFLKRQ